MRRPIGWNERTSPEGRRSVRVNFFAGEFQWRFRGREDAEWREGQVTLENWQELEDKIRQLMQRGHLFDRELELVRNKIAELEQKK